MYPQSTHNNPHPPTPSLSRTKQINLPLITIITPHKQPPSRRIPRSSSQPKAIAIRQPIRRATPRIRRPKDILVPRHTIRRSHRVVAAIRELGKRDLHDLEARGGLAVPGPVEGDVHVLGVGVEGVPDGGRVGHEAQAGGDGFADAGGVGEGCVGGEDELGAGFEAGGGGEGGGVPDCEAGWVAVPGVAGFEGVAD